MSSSPKRRVWKKRLDYDDLAYNSKRYYAPSTLNQQQDFVHDSDNIYTRAEKHRRKKVMDPLYMAGFVDDDTNDYEIEKRFALLENEKAKGLSDQEAARKVYIMNARPSEINDLDSWLNTDLDCDEQLIDDDDDANWTSNDTFPDDIEERRRKRSTGDINKGNQKITKNKQQTISALSDNFDIEKFGPQIERWPIRRLERYKPMALGNYSEVASPATMKNVMNISNSQFEIGTDEMHFFKLDNFKPELVNDIIKKFIGSVDGFVLDPPFNDINYTKEEFTTFIKMLSKTGPNPYFCVWVDFDTFGQVVLSIQDAGLEVCDSVVVELYDSMLEPIEFLTKEGFPQHTRMIILCRVNTTKSSEIDQQRVKDIGWGIVYPNGKSRGRFGMPQVANDILEILLQNSKKKKNFVEIWPSRYTLRKEWYIFDENK